MFLRLWRPIYEYESQVVTCSNCQMDEKIEASKAAQYLEEVSRRTYDLTTYLCKDCAVPFGYLRIHKL